MQEGIESIGEFVVSRGDTAELFEPIEEAFNEMARLVAMPVDRALDLSVVTRRDVGLGTIVFNGFNEVIAVVTLIRCYRLGRDLGNQSRTLRHIGHLPRGENQPNRIAQCIDAGVNFGGQSATRTTDRLIATVFFGAPAECWWARTIVASMKSSSRSALPCNASATRCQTPEVSQRAKRTYTECQLPSSLGRSRHGHPVRAMNRTASTNWRLFTARPPLSVGFPGSRSAIRNHCFSSNIRRSMCHIQISGYKHKSATVNRP